MSNVVLVGEGRAGLRARLEADGHSVIVVPHLAGVTPALAPDVLIAALPADEAETGLLGEVLRASDAPAWIAVIGGESLDQARAAHRLGAADVLSADCDGDVLAEAVLFALGQRRLPAEEVEHQSQLAGVAPTELPRAIVDSACRVLEASHASLFLLGADQRLHMAYSCGPMKVAQENVSLALGERVAGRIAQSGKPALIVGAAEIDPRFAGVSGGQRHVRSSIVYPLMQGERPLGVLNLNRGEGVVPFSGRDLSRTSVFASQVVLALENVRLLKQVAAGEGIAALGLLAQAVAHGINNPAAVVISTLNYLTEELQKPKPSRQELSEAVSDAAQAMRGIRDIVRDFQLLTQVDVRPACFDLSEAIRSANRVAAAVLHNAAVTLDLQAELMVVGSRSGLSQALMNLILNAGAEQSPGRRISIRSQREGAFAVATVSDTGQAIAAGQLATLFEPTFGARGPRFSGLGLAISRDIVLAHGGELLVRSQEGLGTVLTMRLPSAELKRSAASAG